MADKILNTRIKLKIDTLANWNAVRDTFKPLAGEVCIAEVPTVEGSTLQPVMMKIGQYTDSTKTNLKTWGELDWASALAADVYAWAKKPSLDPNDLPEIPGLKLGISFEIVGEGNAITNVDYDTTSKKFTFTKGETFATKKELEDVVANGTVVAKGAKIDVAPDGNTYTVSHEAIAQAEAGKTVAARTYVTGVTTDGYGHITGYTTATEEDQDLSNYKTKQTAVNETGAADKTLKISQDTNGVITATPVDIAITASQVTDFATEVAKIEVESAKNADIAGTAATASHADTATKVDNKLTVGNKIFDGSAAVEVTAADLGLESAMHFVGAFAEAPASATNGDVYLNTANKKEYVYSDGWVELGDEGSYALRTVTITGADGLTGGGDLTANRAIGIADSGVTTAKIADKNVTEAKLSDDVTAKLNKQWQPIGDYQPAGNYKVVQTAVSDPTASGKSLTFIDTIAQNANGEITATKKEVNLDDYALKGELPTVNDGKFTVSGAGYLTGTGEMTANQTENTSATLDLTAEAKGKIDNAVQTVTAGVGIKATKTGTTVNLEVVGKGETDDDGNEVVWIFDCGGAE